MNEPLLDHDGTISIGGRVITDLRFSDDIDGLAESESELFFFLFFFSSSFLSFCVFLFLYGLVI